MIIGTRHRLDIEITRQSRLAQGVARIQTEISGGKRILAPSDDPAGAARVARIGRTQVNEKVWAANTDAAAALASRAETDLSQMTTAVDRAAELLILARSVTATASDRASYANEIASIASDLREIATGKDSRGQAIFPADAALDIPIGPGTTLQATLARGDVFGTGQNELTAVLDAAAAALGTGSSDAIGTALTNLDGARERLTDARGRHGALAARVDAVRDRFADSKVVLAEERAGIESTDVTEAAVRLQANMLTLEAAQAAFARVNKQSLFDLLG